MPEHVGDVGRLELLEVVEREHRPLLIVQPEDGLAELRHFALARQTLVGRLPRRCGGIHARVGIVAPSSPAVDVSDRCTAPSISDCQRQSVWTSVPSCAASSESSGLRPSCAHEVLAGSRDVACLPTDRTGHVILPPQLVEDRATNARYGEGAEREAASRIERLDRCHEADRSGAHQLVEVRLHGEAPGELPRDVMDEIEILAKDLIASEIISGCGPGPEGAGIHGRLGHRRREAGKGQGGPAFEAGGVPSARAACRQLQGRPGATESNARKGRRASGRRPFPGALSRYGISVNAPIARCSYARHPRGCSRQETGRNCRTGKFCRADSGTSQKISAG